MRVIVVPSMRTTMAKVYRNCYQAARIVLLRDRSSVFAQVSSRLPKVCNRRQRAGSCVERCALVRVLPLTIDELTRSSARE
jgi:hypothetical protein